MRGGCAFEFLGEAKVTKIGHAHGIKDAVQMIVLMLDDARVEAAGVPLDHVAVTIHPTVADTPGAGYCRAQSGYRETTLPTKLPILAEQFQRRVDQHGVADRPFLDIVRVICRPTAWNPEHE